MRNQHNIDYSRLNNDMFLAERRVEVAEQIMSVLKDHLRGKKKDSMKSMKCLEIGTSGGVIGNVLADYFYSVVGIDIDKKAAKSWKKYKKKNLTLRLMSALKIDYKDNYFDVVITNQDYECVADSKKFISEIHRVLKKGGVCYFGARNRLTLLEGQYKVPFLSLLPESFGRIYLRLIGREHYFLAHYKTYWGLRKLCRNFLIYDYTLSVLREPKKYKFKKLEKYNVFVRWIPLALLKAIEFLIPNYVWVLAKKV